MISPKPTSGPLGSGWINFRIALFGSGDDPLLTKLTPFTNLEALISTPFLTTGLGLRQSKFSVILC